MATKQQILEKIATLLQDINDQFGQLREHSAATEDLKGDLFEATVSYFAAHVSIYNKLLKSDDSTPPESEEGQTIFTPAIDVEREDAIHAEQIEEVSDSEEEVSDSEEEVADAVADMEAEEKGIVESSTIDETETDEHREEEPSLEVEEEPSQEVSSVETTNDGNEAEDDEAEEVQSDGPSLASDESAGDKGETAETEVREVVNEVTIANKEVQVDPTPERPSRPLSLNERISAQRKGEPAGAYSSLLSAQRGEAERITDIKSAISLNDKLLFIKDLFNGYSLAYSEAIELLNRYDDFASADAFLQANYAKKNSWADKPAAVDKLYTVLRKRFG